VKKSVQQPAKARKIACPTRAISDAFSLEKSYANEDQSKASQKRIGFASSISPSKRHRLVRAFPEGNVSSTEHVAKRILPLQTNDSRLGGGDSMMVLTAPLSRRRPELHNYRKKARRSACSLSLRDLACLRSHLQASLGRKESL
jgi:hypothetical protein